MEPESVTAEIEKKKSSIEEDPAYLVLRDKFRRFAEWLLSGEIDAEKFSELGALEALSAYQDKLTGLYTKSFFDQVFPIKIAAAKRRLEGGGQTLVLMVGDIVGFGDINKKFGHLCGDQVLSAMGEAIRSQIRRGDIAARFGGDEFMIILSDVPSQAVENVVERIENSFRKRTKDLPSGTPDLKFGTAILNEENNSPERLFSAADPKGRKVSF